MTRSLVLASLLWAAVSLASEIPDEPFSGIPDIGDGYVSYAVQNIELPQAPSNAKRQDVVPLQDPATGTFYVVDCTSLKSRSYLCISSWLI